MRSEPAFQKAGSRRTDPSLPIANCDHEELRHDLMFALAVGKIIGSENKPTLLAAQVRRKEYSSRRHCAEKVLKHRIEHCPETVSSRSESRYHRIGHDTEAIESLLVDIFLESSDKPPRSIVLDLDVTDDLVHGNQEQAFFNTYYGGYCYAPLYIFCGKHLLAASLRPSNVDP